MKSCARLALACALLLASALLIFASPAFAQDQINLGDGLFNSHFNGNGTPTITLLIPSIDCSGGLCYLANGSANGTGHLSSNGTYAFASSSNAPFFLVENGDGSATVNQTSPITFSYTSAQGTLTGQIWFKTIGTTTGFLSNAAATLTSPGGSYAPFFPNGGHVNLVLGLTFPLQTLWGVHGFSTVEFQSGTVTPSGSCPALTQGYWKNHPGAWKDGAGLTLGTTFYTNDQLLNLLNTPVNGDASINLAHQLIAALLNMANGTDGTPVQGTIADANNLIGAGPLPENVPASSPLGQQMTGDANTLNNYNNGQITNGCSQ